MPTNWASHIFASRAAAAAAVQPQPQPQPTQHLTQTQIRELLLVCQRDPTHHDCIEIIALNNACMRDPKHSDCVAAGLPIIEVPETAITATVVAAPAHPWWHWALGLAALAGVVTVTVVVVRRDER